MRFRSLTRRLRFTDWSPISWIIGGQVSFVGSQIYFWIFVVVGIGIYGMSHALSPPDGTFQKLFPSVGAMSREMLYLVTGSPWQLPGEPLLVDHVVASLKRIAPLLLGAIIGYAAGLYSVVTPSVSAVMGNFLPFLFATSKMSLFLMLIPILGVFEAPKMTISAWIGFLYVFTAVFSHCKTYILVHEKGTERMFGEFMALIGPTRFGAIWYCFFPLTLPIFFMSLELAFSHAWTMLIFTESFTANDGLGYLIYSSYNHTEFPLLYVATFLLAVCNVITWGCIRLVRYITLKKRA